MSELKLNHVDKWGQDMIYNIWFEIINVLRFFVGKMFNCLVSTVAADGLLPLDSENWR